MSILPGRDSKTRQQKSNQPFCSVTDPIADPHINGEYFRNHPTWHVEFSPWKARNIHQLMDRKHLRPQTIGEVGCGAGEVLRQLQMRLDPECRFWGYDVAPAAISMAREKENERLRFDLADFGQINAPYFDLLLVLEVVDHVEDYLGFLRMLRTKADLKLFSFSLDISVQSILRKGALTKRREEHSHLHHFTKETALSALQYVGYEVLDTFFPPTLALTRASKLAEPIRKLAFALTPESATRMFGGYSLLVLAR